MELYSTILGKKNNSDWENGLTLNTLFEVTGAIRNVTVISAYTDVQMLRKVTNKALREADGRSGVCIRIFLDRLASTYESDDSAEENLVRNELDSIAKLIKKNGAEGSGIWLVKIGSLFHSKAIVVETNTDIQYALGSLNMTRKAFERNEEIMLIGAADSSGRANDAQVAHWIANEYCDALKEHAIQIPYSISMEPSVQDNLQSLMLSGTMFHEMKEADPFRFQLGLPEAFLDVKQSVHPLMKAELKDSISLETIITGNVDNDGLGITLPEIETGTLSWKKFCLDTCYGYWCPAILSKEAQEVVSSLKLRKEPKYNGKNGVRGLFLIVNEMQNELTQKIQDIIEKVDQQIRESGIQDPRWSVDETMKRWNRWYSKLLEKLAKNEIKNRIVCGVYSAPVPNVWSDPITSKEFEHSFAESLLFAWNKGEVSGFRKVVRAIEDMYQIEASEFRDLEPEELVNEMNRRLASVSEDEE